MSIISINDKVRLELGMCAKLKGGAGITTFIIGTIIDKTRIKNSDRDPPNTYYLIQFDKEYYLERSKTDALQRRRQGKADTLYTKLLYCAETAEHCCEFLKPREMVRL